MHMSQISLMNVILYKNQSALTYVMYISLCVYHCFVCIELSIEALIHTNLFYI